MTGDEPNPELADMTRRFWVCLVLTVPLFARHGPRCWGLRLRLTASPRRRCAWIQLVLATPVVLWGGWPFLRRGWQSIVNRRLNMFTLIALGTGVAYLQPRRRRCCPALFPAVVS